MLERYSIAYKELSIGTYHISMQIDNTLFQLFENSQMTSGEGSVEIELSKSALMLSLEIEINAKVGVECDRCLDEVYIPIEYKSSLAVHFSETVEECDGDTMWLSPEEDQLSLAHYIYESLYLSLPYQRIHPEDSSDGSLGCNADMLAHFTVVTEEEFDEISTKGDSATIDESQWSKLQELKDKMTQK